MRNRLLRGLQRWWKGRRLQSGAAVLSARLDSLDARAESKKKEIERLQLRMNSIAESMMEDWEAERVERRVIQTSLKELERKFVSYSGEIDKLRAELDVAEESIKLLTAAHKLALEITDAKTADQIRRQVAVRAEE